jgi:hypothetical protein
MEEERKLKQYEMAARKSTKIFQSLSLSPDSSTKASTVSSLPAIKTTSLTQPLQQSSTTSSVPVKQDHMAEFVELFDTKQKDQLEREKGASEEYLDTRPKTSTVSFDLTPTESVSSPKPDISKNKDLIHHTNPPRTPVPMLELPSKLTTEQTKQERAKSSEEKVTEQNSKSKTYHPGSWRNEPVIKREKKNKEVSDCMLFIIYS